MTRKSQDSEKKFVPTFFVRTKKLLIFVIPGEVFSPGSVFPPGEKHAHMCPDLTDAYDVSIRV